MFINKIFSYYSKSYYKAAAQREQGRATIDVIKNISSNTVNSDKVYQKIKKIAIRFFIGRWYWPSTYPTAIDPPTGEFLYSLVKLTQPQTVVEIGTYKGNAAIAIGQALEDNNKGILYTIDPFEQELVRTAIKKSKLQDKIQYVIGYSHEVVPTLGLKTIDLAFIDGDHSYQSVKKDIELVGAYIEKGGIVVFHDVLIDVAQGFDGPRRVIAELASSNKWNISIYPTEVGVDENNKVCLRNQTKQFTPVGIAVCIKK
ncbi:MAG: hypothetical protein RIQ54_49 [Candidatus Parcubacteria bacterium]|jgi:predicted O-methyltransferase YrrM